ncbi:MAG: 5-(carboxyamino)imidazole ribonucleotide synthase [Sphingobacteriales bacterium]|jgi:5-(carboxyamino)imidazole ribonucleotide synthase|nr:5-(carboxyamino)imidazole ribonucleotide synthase [Sphingobacteriales bacterium]MBP9142414.1 5-(carboxyamino)imidazole ribonucleotide synthase [Chitinophagales bacterium]MDA0197522.1 5-(carboxyamino)imidazole ribonucleotide synthase [Bacteroidota bacterium]MBK6890592.1 5-(carboxyamino)imidazole ribonucleotide synthase [Sphingobacteriales bacterium]MBK7526357.1 5-(carboxyamino)imidazole ribonucleotide synthase [Sphingobacteriales bacterium]
MTANLAKSNLKLGIISGGQLGKMLIQEASKWNIETYVLDNDENCPARGIASHYVKGSNIDFNAVYKFGKMVDILTFEIENINIEALKKLKSEGHTLLPSPEILALIQDKGLQKIFYHQHNLPTAHFNIYETTGQILSALDTGEINYPFVQKLRKGGYDGRGVVVVNNENDLNKLLPDASVVEEKVDIEKEIAVIVARNHAGEIKAYPVVEMLFDPKANLVDLLICPSAITNEQQKKAIKYASQIIELLKMEGLLAVEFFVNIKGQVIVNEIAPRPHNSGHHTIESVVTSQYEQHLRAILNLPLGSTKLKTPSVMLNILGGEGYEGPVLYEGLNECLAIEGVKIHLYGKQITKPFRKMGHVTVLASTVASALQKAEKVKQLVKVKSL